MNRVVFFLRMLQFFLECPIFVFFQLSHIGKCIDRNRYIRAEQKRRKNCPRSVRAITSLIVSRNKRLLEIEFTGKTNFVRTNEFYRFLFLFITHDPFQTSLFFSRRLEKHSPPFYILIIATTRKQNFSILPRSLVFLHWTPSTVIPNERDFVSIDFPRCGATSSEIGCKYESNRLTKLVWARLEYAAKLAYEAINRAKFTREMYEDLIDRRNRDSSMNEEEIACDWLRENLNYTLDAWMPNTADKNILYVGGIFPMSETFYSGKAILVAAMMAKEAINVNNTILRDYNFTLLVNDGQCKSDMVMRSFINYIVHNQYEKLVGVLGPACSETVEPLVGVSKHYKTVVISYSAEGSSFNDRTKYPYFFRTIGENKQYKHVYLQLLKKLGWKRVASLTEDGQKYTEYISYMQDLFRDNGIVFVANAKFPREREPIVMTKVMIFLGC